MGKDFAPIHREQIAQTSCGGKTVDLFEFQNAIVFGQGSVVVGNKHMLLDSAAEFLNHGLAPDGATKVPGGIRLTEGREQRRLSGTSVLVKRPWYRNFGHWMVDLMPILPLLSEAAVHVDRIIFGSVPPGGLHDLMARTAGICYPNADVIFMDDTEQVRSERLLYMQPVHIPPLYKHPMAIQRTVDTCKAIFASQIDFASGERIYVSREKSAVRKLANEEEIRHHLEQAGFQTFHPEDFDLPQQIARMEAAKVIVGVKGAGLTNAIFCKPGTHVLLLSPPNFIDPFFWDLLAPRDIRYSEIFGEADGLGDNPSQVDFKVDIASVQRFLQSI